MQPSFNQMTSSNRVQPQAQQTIYQKQSTQNRPSYPYAVDNQNLAQPGYRYQNQQNYPSQPLQLFQKDFPQKQERQQKIFNPPPASTPDLIHFDNLTEIDPPSILQQKHNIFKQEEKIPKIQTEEEPRSAQAQIHILTSRNETLTGQLNLKNKEITKLQNEILKLRAENEKLCQDYRLLKESCKCHYTTNRQQTGSRSVIGRPQQQTQQQQHQRMAPNQPGIFEQKPKKTDEELNYELALQLQMEEEEREKQRQRRDKETRIFLRGLQQLQRQPNPDEMTYEQLLELQEKIGHVSKGLSQEQINTIQENSISPMNTIITEDCSICFQNFQVGEKFSNLLCSHSFHSNCIKRWLQDQKTCPICKEEHVCHI